MANKGSEDPYGDLMAEEIVQEKRMAANRRPSNPRGVSKLFQSGKQQQQEGGQTGTANKNNNKINNLERNDHLRRLFLKEKLRRAIMTVQQDVQQSRATAPPPANEKDDDDDKALMQELRTEIQQDSQTQALQGKVKEVLHMVREHFGPQAAVSTLKGGFPLEVRIQNLSYSAMRRQHADHDDDDDVKNIGDNNIQTVYNSSFVYKMIRYLRKVSRCQARQTRELSSSEPFYMLHDINLVIQPGVQYLVLGPPASGKTSLLKAIAGLIPQPAPKALETLEGTILYNGKTLKEADGYHIDNAIRYIDQLDKHAARLTVGETFEFAFQCLSAGQMVRDRDGLDDEAIKVADQADANHLARKVVLAALGLSEVENTFVGDTFVRGVSGGQRRRVTVGEMLMSRSPILCGDEISTGLDAASTYDTVQVLLHFGRFFNMARVIALLQPSPETVSLFDEVIVLAEGRIIYAGPIDHVEDYFADLGFQCPPFTDVADFLQLVSTEDGAAKLYQPPSDDSGRPANVPSVEELEALFQKSEFGQRIRNQLEQRPKYVWKNNKSSSFDGKDPDGGSLVENGKVVSGLSETRAVRKKYANNFFRSTQLVTKRFFILWLRDKRVIMAATVKNVLMGLSCGGIFFSTDNPISIQGALFQAGMFVLLGSVTSSAGLVEDRVLFYKHADANFYSSWPYTFGRALAQIPQTLIDTIMFCLIFYYMVGLAGRESVSNFFVFLAILFLFSLLSNQQMAMFASFASNSQMQVYGAVILLLGILFGGFILAPDTIPKYYIWFYWWNPFAWAYRALIVNEFRSGVWEDPDLILTQNGFVGVDDLPFGEEWVGFGCLYMVGYYLICCVLTALGLGYLRNTGEIVPPEKKPPVPEAASEDESPETIEIPFKPLTLSFHDLCYEVTASTSKEKLRLLKNVNGLFRPGRLCALMGSSGAGKTTLMDVIALRKRSGTITGEVRVNGFPQDPISFRRCSGYVEQFSVQSPELTVRETVIFSARLRLDPSVVETDETVVAFADQIIESVELSELAGSLVGSDNGVGLSFEQKKRLSIAVELAASPSIIFLDEPTSGLDARSALLVVRVLRKIADGGRTVTATIHQPSSTIFHMFDDLLLLKKGGQVVFHGELGENSQALVNYFESRGTPKIALGDNPANWMLRVITSDNMGDLAETYKESSHFARLKQELVTAKGPTSEDLEIVYDSEFAASKITREQLISRRLRTIYWRSPAYNLSRIVLSLAMAIVLGAVFVIQYGKTLFTEVEVRARFSVLFLSFIIIGIMAMFAVVPVMTKIRDMFYRHNDAGMYDSRSIGIALATAEKWFICGSSALFCVVFLAVADFGANLNELIWFWGFFALNSALYSYFGQLFVACVKPERTAIILCSVYIGLNNFFSGLIVRPQEMNSGFFMVPYYITPGHYVYEGMITSVFSKDDRRVKVSEGSLFFEFLVEEGHCEDATPSACVGTVSQYVLYFFGGEYVRGNILRNVIILGCIVALVRLLLWAALKYIRFSN